MNKRKTVLLAMIFTVFFSVNVFPAEAGVQAGQTPVNASGMENISDEEMGWPKKYRMKYNYNLFTGHKFIVNDSKYSFAQIRGIFDLTNSVTKKLFHEAYDGYKISENPESYHQVDYIPMVKKAVESFNAFIMSGSPETTGLKEYLKKLFIEKKRAEERERQEEIRLHNSVTSFIGVKATLCLDMGGGLHFAFFFPKSENLKIGFAIDLMYRAYAADLGSHYELPQFVGMDLCFTTKYDWFNFYIGGGIYRRVSKQIVTHDFGGSYLKISDYEFSAIMSLGYLYDGKKFKFFGGLGFRVLLNNSVLANDKDMHVSRLRFTIDLIFGF